MDEELTALEKIRLIRLNQGQTVITERYLDDLMVMEITAEKMTNDRRIVRCSKHVSDAEILHARFNPVNFKRQEVANEVEEAVNAYNKGPRDPDPSNGPVAFSTGPVPPQ